MSRFIDTQKLKDIFNKSALPESTARVLDHHHHYRNLLDLVGVAIAHERNTDATYTKQSISRFLLSSPGFGDAALLKLMDHLLIEIEKLVSTAETQVAPTQEDDTALAIPIVCELIRRMDSDATIGGHGQATAFAEIAIDCVRAVRRKSADARGTQS